jgi:hypothetical protein
MSAILSGIYNAAKNVVLGDKPFQNRPYTKKEYYGDYTGQTGQTKTIDSMWSSLPKINPRVLASGNGFTGPIDIELIRDTNATWDPRGEPDAIKRLQEVTIPGFLMNDRSMTAAQQRSSNRDLQGNRAFQI